LAILLLSIVSVYFALQQEGSFTFVPVQSCGCTPRLPPLATCGHGTRFQYDVRCTRGATRFTLTRGISPNDHHGTALW
jgi:hypothetical protein